MARTNDDWIKIFQNQQRSGLSQAEFCRQNNISESTFSARKSTMKRKNLFSTVPQNIQKQFVEITPLPSNNTQILPEVKVAAGGLTLSFADGIELDSFKQVLMLLKAFSAC